MAILPLSALFFITIKGFVYTITMDNYAKLLLIQHHFTLRLAPKRIAFSTKTHAIQHQNARHLAAKRIVFSSKQPRKWCKRLPLQIKIHFTNIHMPPFFTSKQTFARIDYLRQGGRLVNRSGTHNVKIPTRNQTKHNYVVCARMATASKKMYVCYTTTSTLQCLVLTQTVLYAALLECFGS